MVFDTTSSTDIHHLTSSNDEDDEHQSNLHKLLKTAKFRLIGLNSSFIKRLNGKILDEFHLNERSFGERMRLREDSQTDEDSPATASIHQNYQTLSRTFSRTTNQTINPTIDEEPVQPEETETPANKKFRLKPKKRLLKFLRRLSFKSVYESMNLNLYEELKPSEEEKVKKKKKKKVMKKIRKITMDVCTNISGGVHLMNTGYSYPDQQYNYGSYFGPNFINYHGYDYKANDYTYSTTIIYGPRYM